MDTSRIEAQLNLPCFWSRCVFTHRFFSNVSYLLHKTTEKNRRDKWSQIRGEKSRNLLTRRKNIFEQMCSVPITGSRASSNYQSITCRLSRYCLVKHRKPIHNSSVSHYCKSERVMSVRDLFLLIWWSNYYWNIATGMAPLVRDLFGGAMKAVIPAEAKDVR